MSKETMIGLEALNEIFETGFFSSAVSGSIPISLLLVGRSGSGKSKSILHFEALKKGEHAQVQPIHKTNDVTSSGLHELLDGDKGQVLKHMVIPDFNIVCSHKASTTQLTLANLLTIMSEGSMRIDDGRKSKTVKHDPVGIMTAMTRDIYQMQNRSFQKLGLSRRFTSLFFTYGSDTQAAIQTSIMKGNVTLQQLEVKNIKLPDKKIVVKIPPTMALQIQLRSTSMAANLACYPIPKKKKKQADGKVTISPASMGTMEELPLPFTPHMILRTMAQANAIKHQRNYVNESDIKFLGKFVDFTNYANPKVL